jgi:hypothetical protein
MKLSHSSGFIEVRVMEATYHRVSIKDVVSIQNEILAQLNRMETALISKAQMIMEIGKLRELHQVLIYKIEILKRIDNREQ